MWERPHDRTRDRQRGAQAAQRRERLRPHQGDPRREPAGAPWRDRHRAGQQRRGQDDDSQNHQRHHRPAQGQHRIQGRKHHRAGPGRHRAAGPEPRARGARGVPAALGARQPAHGRLHPQRPRRRGARHGGGVHLFPHPARARRAGRRPALGRAATDAGDQPRAHGQPRPDPARRTQPGAFAEADERDLRDRRSHQPRARHHHPAGGAERQHGAQRVRLRLRAGKRPHRDGRHLRAPAREGRHQGVLPGHERSGRARRPALEKEEELEMTMSYLWDLSHIQPQPEIVLTGDTIPAMFWNAVQKRGPSVWMRQKAFGIWRSWTWDQTGEAVREIAHGLMALGFAPHETASVLSNTTVEWVLADLAVLSAGGVSNGIYPTDAAEQVQFLCEDSGTTVLFVEDDEQLDKALEVRERLPRLKKIVVFDMEGLRDLKDPQVISLEALRELGREHLARHPQALDQRVAGCHPADLAILVYTSGTTGKPKGAMHSHQGLVYTVRGYNTLIARDERDECMCFLPLCHIAERLGGEYFSLYTGAKLNFVENPETVPENV